MSNRYKNSAFAVGIFLIVLGGFLLRNHNLGHQSLWLDEIYTINAASSVVEHGYPILDSGRLYVNNFVTVYLTAALMSTFDLDPFNPWIVRLPGVFFGTLLILVVVLLAHKLSRSRSVALLSAFFIAFSYNEIAFSRQVRGYAVFALCITSALFYVFKYLELPQKKYLIYSGILFLISCLSHWVALVFILPIFLIVFVWKRAPLAFPHFSKSILAITALVLLVCLPILQIAIYEPVKSVVLRYFFFTTLPFIVILLTLGVKSLFDYFFPTKTTLFKLSLSTGVVILLAYSFLVFRPQNNFVLSSVSPQPNYKEVFSIIKSNIREGDMIVSLRPVLQLVYLKKEGYWILRESKGAQREDFYTGIKSFGTYSEFKKILGTQKGYFVVDSYIFDELLSKEKTIDMELIYTAGIRPIDKIWLYRF